MSGCDGDVGKALRFLTFHGYGGMGGMKVKHFVVSTAFPSDFNAEALMAENGIFAEGIDFIRSSPIN